MKKSSWLAGIFGLVGLMSACTEQDAAGVKKAVEAKLNATPFASFRTGKIALDRPNLERLRLAEAQGLITIRELPQAYWDSFLAQTQGRGTPFEVTATPKLLAIAQPAKGASSEGDNVVLSVKIFDMAVDEIVTDEKYQGPLASPGENHRLVLGVATMKPTTAARTLGKALAPMEESRNKFRCVVRYSKFKKEWQVVVCDTGSLGTDEQWFSENVK